jgi:hypothetical protein
MQESLGRSSKTRKTTFQSEAQAHTARRRHEKTFAQHASGRRRIRQAVNAQSLHPETDPSPPQIPRRAATMTDCLRQPVASRGTAALPPHSDGRYATAGPAGSRSLPHAMALFGPRGRRPRAWRQSPCPPRALPRLLCMRAALFFHRPRAAPRVRRTGEPARSS